MVASASRRILWWIGGALLAAVVVSVLLVDRAILHQYNPGKAKAAGLGQPIQVASAAVQDVGEVIGANATVDALTDVDLKGLVAARVLSVPADLGMMFRQGAVLAELDRTLLAAALKASQDDVAKATIELANSRLQYQRNSDLYAQGLIPKVDLEDAEARLKSAEASAATASHALAQARYNYDNAVIRAPVDSVIKARQIDPGESVKVGDPLFTLGRLDAIYAVAQVAEEKIAKVMVGQEAEIVFDAYPNETVKGKVAKIDPNTDPKTRTFPVYVRIENRDLKYRPGLSAYVRLKYARQALVVPSIAVIQNSKEATVFVVESDRARLRPVKVESATLGRTIVMSGLEPGDKVVTFGLFHLSDNDRVNLKTLAQQ